MFYSSKLKKLKNIKHCFFSRKNGFSKGIYKGLNCGKGSKDSKNNINKNLNFVAKKMGVKNTRLILMHQTHSAKVIEIKKDNYKKMDILLCHSKNLLIGQKKILFIKLQIKSIKYIYFQITLLNIF